MTFGWVVGYTPGVLKMNTQIEQFPYPRPIMFNFQLLRNDDHKQIHKSKYWFDNFFGEPDPIPLFFGGGTKNRLFQQLRVEYSKCPRLNSTHEIAQWNWCAPGETLAGTVSGCSGRIRKNLKMPFPYRINGKWYIYLLIYHPKSNYECRCRCIPCMDPMGLFVFSCWHTLMCWGEMCWYAQVHQKKLTVCWWSLIPNLIGNVSQKRVWTTKTPVLAIRYNNIIWFSL